MQSQYLWWGCHAAAGGQGHWWVRIVDGILDHRPFEHLHVSDGEDALATGARDPSFIPVLIHSSNQRDPFTLWGGIAM